MGTLKNNPKYAKMFSAVSIKSAIELKEAFMILQFMPLSSERSLTGSIIIEQLETLVGIDEINAFLDAIDSLEEAA